MTKNINIDDNAHMILLRAKQYLREAGVDAPNLSDAIRYLDCHSIEYVNDKGSVPMKELHHVLPESLRKKVNK